MNELVLFQYIWYLSSKNNVILTHLLQTGINCHVIRIIQTVAINNNVELHNDLSIRGPCSVGIRSYSFSPTSFKQRLKCMNYLIYLLLIWDFAFIYCHFFFSTNINITKSFLLAMFHLSVFHVFCAVQPFTFVWVVYSFWDDLHKIILATSPNPASARDIQSCCSCLFFISLG